MTKRVALVTGGTRGIGFGIALKLAEKGFDLAINATRPEEEVGEALKQLDHFGVDVLYCQGDISSSADREAIFRKVRSHYDRLNALVNNAGVAPRERKDVLEASEESFDEVISVNLKGSYFMMQAAARWMVEQKGRDPEFKGSIINITSISATVASLNRGEYCVSKAAMSMATQLFAVRLGAYEIPVFEVRPGVIYTDMTAPVKEKYDRLIADGLCPQQRWGSPEDVGKVVAALANGDFGYSTGQVVMVDGGLTIPRL